MFSFKKGLSPYVFLFIILIGITVALVLIRNPQIFSPKANTSLTFSLKPPVASCLNGRPTVTLEWTALPIDPATTEDPTGSSFQYEVYYRENGGPEIRVGSAKTNLIYQLSTLDGLQPGKSYGFLVAASANNFGPVYASQNWSDNIYGWTTIPASCNPTNSPTPASPSPGAGPGKVTLENFEPKLNPYGEAWAWKKAPNPTIPVSVGGAGLGQYLSNTYQDSDGKIKEALAQYYAKTNSGYVYLDSFEPGEEGLNPRSVAVITRAKQINPNIKFLGYFVQWETHVWNEEIIAKANAGDQNFENFFVHIDGRPKTKANRLKLRPDKPEWEGGGPVLDITNPNLRAFVTSRIVAKIQAAKMDGLMNDLLFVKATDAFNPTNHYPDNIMPQATKNAWPASMAQFVQEIRTQMNGKNLEIFGNVNDDAPQFMQNDLLRAGRLDGVIFEDPFNSRPDPTGVTKVTNLMNLVDQTGRKAIYVVSGAHNATTFGSTNQNEETLSHRYFLAAFMMVMRNGNNMFEYHYPTSIFHQYNSQAFFKEWDLALGPATSGMESVGNGVLLRKFQKGYVYLNPTNSNFTITGGSGLYNIDNGQDIGGQIVPARSGAFFVTQALLNEYNTPPPTPAPPPSPSATTCQSLGGICVDSANKSANGSTCSTSLNAGPTPDCTGTHIYCFAANSCTAPSPSPSRSADIDNNGVVDAGDINRFVQNFINQNLNSDFDNDGDVDVFDYGRFVWLFRTANP